MKPIQVTVSNNKAAPAEADNGRILISNFCSIRQFFVSIIDGSIVSVSMPQLAEELLEAVRKDSLNDFRQKYITVAVLLINDFQFLVGKQVTQQIICQILSERCIGNKLTAILSEEKVHERLEDEELTCLISTWDVL